jgi:hypothetical protein
MNEEELKIRAQLIETESGQRALELFDSGKISFYTITKLLALPESRRRACVTQISEHGRSTSTDIDRMMDLIVKHRKMAAREAIRRSRNVCKVTIGMSPELYDALMNESKAKHMTINSLILTALHKRKEGK